MPHSAPYNWSTEFALPPHRPVVAGDVEPEGYVPAPPAATCWTDSDPTPPYGIVRGLWLVRP